MLNSKLKGIPRNNNEDRGPITSSTVFHSLKFKAMQDVHLCMYVCMYACVFLKKTLSFIMFDLSEDSNQNEKQQLAI